MRGVGLVAIALGGLGLGCHRSVMPPRPDGAAVVISPETIDDGVATVPEIEPNDSLATAQRLPVTPAAPVAIAATLQARPPGAKRDVDLYQLALPPLDGGTASGSASLDGGAALPPFLLRADVRPVAGLAVTLEALDAAGIRWRRPPVNRARRSPSPTSPVFREPGSVRVRASGTDSGANGYRLVVHLVPFDAGAEIEPNGDAAHATTLAPGGEAVGYLGWRRDQDWYRLPTAGIAEGSVLSVDLDPVPEVAASLQLYGADAHKLTEARGRKGERVVLRNVRLPAGDPAFSWWSGPTPAGAPTPATTCVRAPISPRPAPRRSRNDDQAHAQAIGDGTVLGYLARGDVDFFRYSTEGRALLDLEVAPPERGGVEIEVSREDSTLLARAQSGHHAPARIAGQPIPGGPILIRVVPLHGTIDSDDPYRLTVSSRPATAADVAPKAE